MPSTVNNLIDDRYLTAALLLDPLAWRVRVVEEISVEAATHCRRRRSLQVAPLRGLLGPFLETEASSEALVALNVAPIPRGPLLDFDVQGPYGDAWLLPRTEIAAREAVYLSLLAARCDLRLTDVQTAVLTSVLAFTGSRWFIDRETIPFGDYMADGLGVSISQVTLDLWQAIGRTCRGILRPYLDDFHGYSAPENPALALPTIFGEGISYSEEAATRYLQEYESLLQEISLQASSTGECREDATEFLGSLADYGNNYDLMVALKVPIDEPFLIKYSERRSLALGPITNIGQQELVISDAATNHVTFKISDPNVRIADFRAMKPGGSQFADGAFLSRSDEQTRSFYAYDLDRDYRIRLVFRLALLRRLQMVPYFASALLIGLTAALLREQPRDLRTLAIVVGPSALAASVLLAREPSTLGSRLRLLSSIAVSVALLVLVTVAAGLYIRGVFCP